MGNENLRFMVEEKFDRYTLEENDEGNNFAHEAGYDALMTGYVFANFLAKLG